MRFDLIEREMKEMENKTANEKLLHPLCGFVCVFNFNFKSNIRYEIGCKMKYKIYCKKLLHKLKFNAKKVETKSIINCKI